jgi:hypothetical protein
VGTREGLKIIGGPQATLNAAGVFSDAQTNKHWPYVHGAKMIGLMVDEYVCKGKPVWYNGSDCKHVHTHYWVADPERGELRYKGTARNREAAAGIIRGKQRVAAQVIDAKEKTIDYGTPPKRARSTG